MFKHKVPDGNITTATVTPASFNVQNFNPATQHLSAWVSHTLNCGIIDVTVTDVGKSASAGSLLIDQAGVGHECGDTTWIALSTTTTNPEMEFTFYMEKQPCGGGQGIAANGGKTPTKSELPSPLIFDYGLVVSDILPITLLDFTGSCDHNGIVSLRWRTATESNNDYFSIERGIETAAGIEWAEIAQIKGAGNSNTPLSYAYVDNQAYTGVNYYRLKQTDYNGKSETFSPIAVACTTETGSNITVYPNPTTGQLTINNEQLVAMH
jgi:hypothetical protein